MIGMEFDCNLIKFFCQRATIYGSMSNSVGVSAKAVKFQKLKRGNKDQGNW